MTRMHRTFSIFLLFLLAGSALAQTSGDEGMNDAEQECHDRYERDLAEADEDYQESQHDSGDSPDAARSDEAEEQYKQDRAEADERYQDCMEDAAREEADERDEASAIGDDRSEDDADDDRDREESDGRDDDASIPGSYSGDHITFSIARDGVRDYTVDDHQVFAAVSAAGPVGWDEFEAEGASVKLEGDGAELKASDTPTGVFRFEVDGDGAVHITFGDDIQGARPATDRDRHGHGGNQILLTGDGFQAILSTDDGYRLDRENRTLVAYEGIRVVVVDAPGLASKSAATVDGIADGRIAVEVDVSRDGVRSAEHGDVNITIETTESGLIATVDSDDPTGRTILFNLEPGAYDSLDDIQVRFDDETIGLADNMEDVMDVADGVAEYLIIVGATETQVLVQVPHFSVHTIQLDGALSEGTATPAGTLALVVGGGVAAVFVATTLIGRRRGG